MTAGYDGGDAAQCPNTHCNTWRLTIPNPFAVAEHQSPYATFLTHAEVPCAAMVSLLSAQRAGAHLREVHLVAALAVRRLRAVHSAEVPHGARVRAPERGVRRELPARRLRSRKAVPFSST